METSLSSENQLDISRSNGSESDVLLSKCLPFDGTINARQIYFIKPEDPHSNEIWETGMIVPDSEKEDYMLKSSEGSYLVRFLLDNSFALVHESRIFIFSVYHEPFTYFDAVYPDFKERRGIRYALEFIKTGNLPTGFKWPAYRVEYQTPLPSSDYQTVPVLSENIGSNSSPDSKSTAVETLESAAVSLSYLKSRKTTDKVYQDIAENITRIDRDQFITDLYGSMEEKGRMISKLPSLGYQELDLFKLYCLVVIRGGMDEVTRQQEWKSVYQDLNIPTMSTSASYNTRTNYKKFLYLYELEHFDPITRKICLPGQTLASSENDADFQFKAGQYVRIISTFDKAIYYGLVLVRLKRSINLYYIQYNGWGSSHDEWVPEINMENLAEEEKVNPKRLANPAPNRSSKSNNIIDHGFVLEHLYTARSSNTQNTRKYTRKVATPQLEGYGSDNDSPSGGYKVPATTLRSIQRATARSGNTTNSGTPSSPVQTRTPPKIISAKRSRALMDDFKELVRREHERTFMNDSFLLLQDERRPKHDIWKQYEHLQFMPIEMIRKEEEDEQQTFTDPETHEAKRMIERYRESIRGLEAELDNLRQKYILHSTNGNSHEEYEKGNGIDNDGHSTSENATSGGSKTYKRKKVKRR